MGHPPSLLSWVSGWLSLREGLCKHEEDDTCQEAPSHGETPIKRGQGGVNTATAAKMERLFSLKKKQKTVANSTCLPSHCCETSDYTET